MDSLTFTINLKDLDACDGDFDQVVSDIQAFINILHRSSPDYYLAGDVLQKQLDEQVKKHKEETADPKEQMRKYLDSVCPLSIDGELASAGFWKYYDELRESIGKAMGPVSYAAFDLARYIEEQNLPAYKKEHDAGTKWVWDFVKYYEDHWEF